MIRCQNLTEEDLLCIGKQVAETFLAEKGCFSILPPDVAGKMFYIIVKTCYETGHLYTTGEKREGFCVYWTKKERPGLWVQLKMALKMAVCVPAQWGLMLKKNQSNWLPTEKRYKKADDFVEVFLLAVRREYQGKGYFRKMLEEPFALARKRGTLCVLDTDSQIKADKYTHVGMCVADSRKQQGGITMYALEYRGEA